MVSLEIVGQWRSKCGCWLYFACIVSKDEKRCTGVNIKPCNFWCWPFFFCVRDLKLQVNRIFLEPNTLPQVPNFGWSFLPPWVPELGHIGCWSFAVLNTNSSQVKSRTFAATLYLNQSMKWKHVWVYIKTSYEEMFEMSSCIWRQWVLICTLFQRFAQQIYLHVFIFVKKNTYKFKTCNHITTQTDWILKFCSLKQKCIT